jgi:Thrombospondin type 1 domain.
MGNCPATDWSVCSQTCGGGTQTRKLTGEAPTGMDCSQTPLSQPCNTQPCDQYQDCPTTPWSVCSQTCGGGITTRQFLDLGGGRVISEEGMKLCPLSQPCNTQPCSGNDAPNGQPETYQDCPTTTWSVCSKTCGSGTKTRQFLDLGGGRVISEEGMKLCPLSQPCNTQPCSGNEQVQPPNGQPETSPILIFGIIAVVVLVLYKK